jgi:hypothetical protein
MVYCSREVIRKNIKTSNQSQKSRLRRDFCCSDKRDTSFKNLTLVSVDKNCKNPYRYLHFQDIINK